MLVASRNEQKHALVNEALSRAQRGQYLPDPILGFFSFDSFLALLLLAGAFAMSLVALGFFIAAVFATARGGRAAVVGRCRLTPG